MSVSHQIYTSWVYFLFECSLKAAAAYCIQMGKSNIIIGTNSGLFCEKDATGLCKL